jgi:hypothetical protein
MPLQPWIGDPPPDEELPPGGPEWEAEIAAKEPYWWRLPDLSDWS